MSFYERRRPDDATLLRGLNYVPGNVTITESRYLDFCDRVRPRENELRAFGRWNLPHPWVDLFVPDREADDFIRSVLDRDR